MKTSEFIKTMESLGYKIIRKYGSIYISNGGPVLVEVLEYKFASIDTKWTEFDELEQDEQENILEAAYTYITTPLCERDDEVKYYLKLDCRDIPVEEECLYLNYDRLEKEYFFDTLEEDERFQTKFIQEEIDKLDTTHLIKEEVKC